MKVVTDKTKIKEILDRGTVVDILPTREEFIDKLASGERLRFYLGIDATAPVLHLSHAKNFMFLEKIRQLGHEVIVLFGDFTARIGDPTGEDSKRKQLSRKEVLRNIKAWKRMIKPFMNFNTFKNPPKIKHNHKWLSKLSFEDVVNLASNFTVQHIISRDMFQKRIKEERPIYLHEFFYPLMQGYDSVAMDVDVEVCGTDQTFNALAGRTLLKKLKNKEKFVVALTLMENPKTGELMSKSKGTGVFLGTNANDMFGQIMAQPDEMVEVFFINNTLLSKDKIKEIIDAQDPKNAKIILALEIVSICYGKDKAQKAKENWENTFSKGEVPIDIKEVSANGETFADLFVKEKVVASKSEFRRLVDEGAVSEMETGEKVSSHQEQAKVGTYKIGKKRFIKII